VVPLTEGTALEVVEAPKADIIDNDGYVNGLPAVFIIDSAYKLMVVVRDRQGQLLEWEIGPGNYRLVKLELGGTRSKSTGLGLTANPLGLPNDVCPWRLLLPSRRHWPLLWRLALFRTELTLDNNRGQAF
jgi:hypothetical protein